MFTAFDFTPGVSSKNIESFAATGISAGSASGKCFHAVEVSGFFRSFFAQVCGGTENDPPALLLYYYRDKVLFCDHFQFFLFFRSADDGNGKVAESSDNLVFLDSLMGAPQKTVVDFTAAPSAGEVVPVQGCGKIQACIVIYAGKTATGRSNGIFNNSKSLVFNHLKWPWLPKHFCTLSGRGLVYSMVKASHERG